VKLGMERGLAAPVAFGPGMDFLSDPSGALYVTMCRYRSSSAATYFFATPTAPE